MKIRNYLKTYVLDRITDSIHWLMIQTGHDIKKIPAVGKFPFKDMRLHLNGSNPVIFDVGANTGQSVKRFKKTFPCSYIYSFEPSPETFIKLSQRAKDIQNVSCFNCAVGSETGWLPFLENDLPDRSSFLEPAESIGGKVVKTTNVPVITIDNFANEHNIQFIDILKSDTQGYELEVLKGAESLMKENKIGMVYLELIISEQYKGLPPFYEIFKLLLERNFLFVCFYEQRLDRNLISWTDVLFINKEYYKKSGH